MGEPVCFESTDIPAVAGAALVRPRVSAQGGSSSESSLVLQVLIPAVGCCQVFSPVQKALFWPCQPPEWEGILLETSIS